MTVNGEQFNLVFEGPVDDSPDTMRRLKAALLVDMAFSIDRIQEALSKTPYTLITTSNEDDLQQYAELLKAAGGKTCIVKATDADANSNGSIFADFDDLAIHFDEEEAIPVKSPELIQAPIQEVESFDDDSLLNLNEDDEPVISEPKPTIVQQQKVLTPPSSMDLAFDEATEETPVEVKPVETKPTPAPTPTPEPSTPVASQESEETVEFSFTIGDEEAPKPKKAKAYKLSLDEQPASEIPEMLEKEPVGPLVSLLAKVKDKTEKDLAEHAKQDMPPTDSTESHPLLKGTGPKEQSPLSSTLQSRSSTVSVKEEKVEEKTETTEVEKPIAARHPRRSLLKELALPVLLGIPIVVATNLFYFQFSNNKEAASFMERIKNLSAPLAASAAKEGKKEPEVILHILTGDYSGEQKYQNRTIQVKGNVSIEDKKARVLVDITTPEPQELTLEQIGRQESRPVWVRNITIDEGTYDVSTQGTFEGQSPARIYLDDNGDSKRLVGTGKVSGKIDAEKRVAEVFVSVVYGAPQANSEFSLKKKGAGDFDLTLSGKVLIKKSE